MGDQHAKANANATRGELTAEERVVNDTRSHWEGEVIVLVSNGYIPFDSHVLNFAIVVAH
jgi:hypothetical protein